MYAHPPLHCDTCGRTKTTPWPEEYANAAYHWVTEIECYPCWMDRHKKREETYRKAVETLLGKFTDEQFEALKIVLKPL